MDSPPAVATTLVEPPPSFKLLLESADLLNNPRVITGDFKSVEDIRLAASEACGAPVALEYYDQDFKTFVDMPDDIAVRAERIATRLRNLAAA
jgi:hypothetical protein